MKIIKTFKETISDGLGFRYSIYFSGCNHYCDGCHNHETWKGDIGEEVTEEHLDKIANYVNDNSMNDGITLSGGDPFFNPNDLLKFLKGLRKRTDKNLWSYTGYKYEEILQNPVMKECLEYIDILVDGKFEKDKRHIDLTFRGSSNQRIIDVKESLVSGKVEELDL